MGAGQGCSGFTHALALLCQVLRARGGTAIAVEQYGPQAHRRIVRAHGLRCLALPVDRDGAVPRSLGRAAAAVLTPAHQFPLGMALAPRRRRDFIEWASASGGLVIEDDYDGEFRYDRQPVGAMQALAPDHVVYAGTASKSLAPGLRLGWLASPRRCWKRWSPPRRRRARTPAASTSSPWPACSPRAATTARSGTPGWPTAGAATGWQRPCCVTRRAWR